MAKALPSAQDLGVASAQPTLSVASYKGATGMEDDAARATMYAGQQFAQVAQRMEQEQEKLDNLRAEDRINQYQEELNKLALDPEAGWANAKGEKAIGGDFVKTHGDKFEEARNKLLDSLDTPGAKRRFAQLSAGVTMRHRSKLYEHSAKERIAYDAKVNSDAITGIKQEIWRSHGDDGLFEANMARAVALSEEFARSQGVNEEGIKNSTRELKSSLWKQRIGAAVAAGDTMLAREYMGKATGTLTSADKAEIDAKIRPQMQAAEVQTTVSGLLDNMMSKDPNDPFPANAIDEALRKKYGNNPQALQLARAEVAHRRGQNEIQQKEFAGKNIGAVSQAFMQGRSMADIARMPEFQALSGDMQLRMNLQMETVMHQREGRREVAEGRALQALSRQQLELKIRGMDTFFKLHTERDRVKAMTPAELQALPAEIGFDNAIIISNMHKALNSEKGYTAAKLTAQAFNGIVADFLTPEEQRLLASSPKSDDKRTEKWELQRRISAANLQVNAIVQARKATTLEEAQEIARQELKKTIQLRDTNPVWFSNAETRRSLLNPRPLTTSELARVYVPLNSVPKAELEGAAVLLRKWREKHIGNQKIDARFYAEHRVALERLLGLKSAGLTVERMERIMTGVEKIDAR